MPDEYKVKENSTNTTDVNLKKDTPIEEDDDIDLDDWSKKYDVTITALSQEYYDYISMIRQTDEKTNKYLVILSIFIAGFFTAITSSLTDKLKFNTEPLTGVSFLSWCFILSLIICCILGFIVIRDFLKSLDYIQTVRLPNLEQKLSDTGSANYVEYQHAIIHDYQQAIIFLQKTGSDKREKVKSATKKVPFFLSFMILSLGLLFVIKLVSQDMTKKNPNPPSINNLQNSTGQPVSNTSIPSQNTNFTYSEESYKLRVEYDNAISHKK